MIKKKPKGMRLVAHFYIRSGTKEEFRGAHYRLYRRKDGSFVIFNDLNNKLHEKTEELEASGMEQVLAWFGVYKRTLAKYPEEVLKRIKRPDLRKLELLDFIEKL